ncbi:MAG: hypothetical protein GY874_14630 [Desulfobacteraceae bacterium]|nr:hypothetical protein [Desulfobacteraceae bacterium]
MLGNPGEDSITVSVLPNDDMEFYYTCGTTSGNLNSQTETLSAENSAPVKVEFEDLLLNSRYYYQLHYKNQNSVGSEQAMSMLFRPNGVWGKFCL